MSWLNGRRNGHNHSHIDPATGRNKRDNTRRHREDCDWSQAPKRRDGKIADRKASARKMKVERAQRRRAR
jgi:hypothetical protein